jgi:hypothetical protein
LLRARSENISSKSELNEELHIVPYDPSWPSAFEAEAIRIPGLAAKPIIEIQISVENLQPMDRLCNAACAAQTCARTWGNLEIWEGLPQRIAERQGLTLAVHPGYRWLGRTSTTKLISSNCFEP